MDNWKNGVRVYANRLYLPVANVVEQLSELLVGTVHKYEASCVVKNIRTGEKIRRKP